MHLGTYSFLTALIFLQAVVTTIWLGYNFHHYGIKQRRFCQSYLLTAFYLFAALNVVNLLIGCCLLETFLVQFNSLLVAMKHAVLVVTTDTLQ